MKYKVEITEVLQKVIEVEAIDENDAYLKIKNMYRSEKIILDDTSYVDTEIKVVK